MSLFYLSIHFLLSPLFLSLALALDIDACTSTYMPTWLNRPRNFTRRSNFSSVSDVQQRFLSPCSSHLSRSNSSMILRLFSSLLLVLLLIAHGVQSTSSKFDADVINTVSTLVLSVAQRGHDVFKLLKDNRERLKHGSRTSS